MRHAAIAIVVATLMLPPAARGETVTPDPHAQAAAELLTTLRADKQMAVGAELMADVLIERNAMLAPYRDVLLKWAASVMSMEKLGPQIAALYQDAFTDAELRDMTAFYRTPTGQKALIVLPLLARKMAELGTNAAQQHAAELETMIRARAAELTKVPAQP